MNPAVRAASPRRGARAFVPTGRAETDASAAPSMRAVGLDVVLVLLAVVDLLASVRPERSLAFAVSALAVVVLPLRRRAPLAVLLLGLPNVLDGYALVAQLIAVFTLAHRVRDRRLVIAGVALVGAAQIVAMVVLDQDPVPAEYSAQIVVFAVLIVGGPAALGLLVRAYGELRVRMADLLASQQREQALVTDTVLAHERARVAREMHDIVSHQVSLIAVQTGALRMTATDPTTRDTADTVRRLAVKTLEELREMVGVLRRSGQPDGASSELSPQPRVADLPRLVRDSDTGARLVLPDGVDYGSWPEAGQRAVFRTVQEGLTNVRKHAPGAPVTVTVTPARTEVTVSVVNGPGPAPSARLLDRLPGGGQGLVGLRERADLLGGRLQHHPTSDGGFELRLQLPLPAAASTALFSA